MLAPAGSAAMHAVGPGQVVVSGDRALQCPPVLHGIPARIDSQPRNEYNELTMLPGVPRSADGRRTSGLLGEELVGPTGQLFHFVGRNSCTPVPLGGASRYAVSMII